MSDQNEQLGSSLQPAEAPKGPTKPGQIAKSSGRGNLAMPKGDESLFRGFTLRQLEKVRKQSRPRGGNRYDDDDLNDAVPETLDEDEDSGLSDDNKEELVVDMRQKRRFGHVIKKDRTKISNFLKVIAVVIAIVFIPLQIFLKAVLEDFEARQLKRLQVKLEGLEGSVFFRFLWFVLHAADSRVTMAVAMFLFLATDSFIAFKTTLLYFSGLWMIILLKMLYESPRPFWVDGGVRVFEGFCAFDYASPSSHMFNLFFFYGYSIFMYFVKYTEEVNYKVVYTLYLLLAIVICINAVGMYAFGILFIYQAVVSILYSTSFAILCINFDQQIVTYCEKVGFIIQSSRQMKFIVLFWCLGFLFFAVLLYVAQQDHWADQQYWVINASDQADCSAKLFTRGATRLGGQDTFMSTSILFYIIGLGFGTSYSLLEVDCFDFVRTHWAKKVGRAILGCALAEGIYAIFVSAFPQKSTFLTRFCFEGVFPYFLVPFIVYGPFQVLCKKIGLVDADSAVEIEAAEAAPVDDGRAGLPPTEASEVFADDQTAPGQSNAAR